ncbi:heterokaryon incompatibility protein-domain-containing protein [Xylaria curta]|nr:heterokaryon incompatibility protein-domain-containing protein [Xylaria curta]
MATKSPDSCVCGDGPAPWSRNLELRNPGTENTSLCIKCQLIFENYTQPPNWEFFICQHINTVEDSAERGCELCALILAGFSDHMIECMRLTTEPRVVMCYVHSGRYNRTALECSGLTHRKELFRISIIPAAEVDNEPDFAQLTSTRQSLDLATRWFRTCDKSHPACMVDNTKAYPRRLLSISSNVLHLVPASEIPDRPRYATLSHCWGTLELLKLQKENYNSFLVKIEESELCQTFRDTIRIVKHLGLEYLWIDSLCIVQDDYEDWIRESANMCDVYGGSSINIAATSARDGSFGCFADRDKKTLRNIRKIRVPVSVENKITLYDCASEDIYHTVDSGPLTYRAWAFQERFLAHRTLIFTNSQLFWECETILACETFPDKVPEDYCWEYKMPKVALLSHNREKSVIPYEKKRSELNISMAGLLVPDPSLLRLWSFIVINYSRAKLTKPTDKLVALSGVAKWLQNRNNDVYLAGMWRRGLEVQLCWKCHRSDEENPLTRPAEYIAPSWSWASTNSEIIFYADFMGCRFRTNVRVLSADVKPETIEAPLGRVLDGALCLSFDKIYSRILIPNEKPFDTAICLDYPTRKATLAYILPIYSERHEDPSRSSCTRGIVLESAESDGKTFRRIGYFQFGLSIFDRFGSQIVDYSRFQENGKNLYTLTII